MTRPSKSALVLDGSEVKLRLMAERAATKTPVHVDWVRFTTLCRNQPRLAIDRVFSEVDYTDPDYRKYEFQRMLDAQPDPDFSASAQALALAEKTVQALGPEFTINPVIGKGHDFYKYRWIIERNESECGWVGFLSSGTSAKQAAQANTLHVNLFGAACTFAPVGWNNRLADLIEEVDGVLTRCDLALDFFDGYPGGVMSIFEAYRAGECDVGGRRLKSSCVGDWANGHSRSFYFGSKESGKQTNCYEKGDQLFGHEAGTTWLRAELRYGNKLRVLPADMLRRPADFFAGASDWHAQALRLAEVEVQAEKVSTIPRLALETVEAECFKNIKWALKTAAPTMAALFSHLGEDFLEFVTNKKLPARLQKFSPSELSRAFSSAMGRISQPESAPAFAMA